MKVLLSKEYCDNPKLPITEPLSFREPNLKDLAQANQSLDLDFDNIEAFISHNSDLHITKAEFVEMWDKYQEEKKEGGAYWPTPRETHGDNGI